MGFPGGRPELLSPPALPCSTSWPAADLPAAGWELLLDREVFGEDGEVVTRIEVCPLVVVAGFF